MKDFVEFVAKGLVDKPEDVQVVEVEGEQGAVLELRVAKEDLGKVIGKTGTVYIPIPAKGHGKGKINLVVDDKMIEVDAVNESEDPLSTGAAVSVTSRLDETTLVVRSI